MSGQVSDARVVPSHLRIDWRLIVALVLFLPLGLVVGWYRWREAQAEAAGESDAAARAEVVSRRWFIAAVVVGVLIDLLIAAVLVFLGAFPTG